MSARAKQPSWQRQLLNAYKDKGAQKQYRAVKNLIETCLLVVNPEDMPNTGLGAARKIGILSACLSKRVIVAKHPVTQQQTTAQIKQALSKQTFDKRVEVAKETFTNLIEVSLFAIPDAQFNRIFAAALESKRPRQVTASGVRQQAGSGNLL